MKIIGIILLVIGLFVAGYGAIGYISDTTRVVKIEQKAMGGDIPDATNEAQQFATDKAKEAANDIAVGAIFAVFLEIGTVIAGIIGGIIVFLKGLGLL
jgi:hypothetical protein